MYRRKRDPVQAMCFTGENGAEMMDWLAGLRVTAAVSDFGPSGEAVRTWGGDSAREERAFKGQWLVFERGRVRSYSAEDFEARFEEE